MKVLKANDGFLWADVTPVAESLWYTGDWDCMPFMMMVAK